MSESFSTIIDADGILEDDRVGERYVHRVECENEQCWLQVPVIDGVIVEDGSIYAQIKQRRPVSLHSLPMSFHKSLLGESTRVSKI